MAKKIVWTKRANARFNEVIGFLEEEWGEHATRNFVQKVYAITELLSRHPALGSVEKRNENIRGFVITKHNRLFYRETDDSLIILNLFDTRSGSAKKRY